MAHRAKHRTQALIRRVKAGRTIKSDETPSGQLEYERIKLSLKQPRAKKVVHDDD